MASSFRRRATGPGPFQRVRIWLFYGGFRDLWMAAITVVVLIAVARAGEAADDATDAVTQVQEGRRTGTLDACRNDQAQDDVLRALINASLRQRAQENPRRDRFGRTDADRTKLAEMLMEPLGGLTLTTTEARSICQRRLERARATR